MLERDRVGSSWAGLWESFRVNTPNWGLRLPGMAYDGDDPDGFMPRSDIVAYLERYARRAPARSEQASRSGRSRAADDGFLLDTSVGPIAARSVVTCTGAYQRPHRPPGADRLPGGLPTFDTRSYRSPEMLPDGARAGRRQRSVRVPDRRGALRGRARGRRLVRQGIVGTAPDRRPRSAVVGPRDRIPRGRHRDAAIPGGQARRQRDGQRYQGRPRPARPHAPATRARGSPVASPAATVLASDSPAIWARAWRGRMSATSTSPARSRNSVPSGG